MSQLPTGTVTMLFTDVEGSTRLLARSRDGYAEVIAAHRGILDSARERHRGELVDTQGDSSFLAFRGALEAISAAAEIQRAHTAYEWPPDAVVRVRIGVHSGEPVVAEGRYIGLDVHRASRICDAGHGGQVLVSRTTQALVEGELGAGLSLRDLGEHHLKDLDRPERLFQLEVDGLGAQFPELNTTGRHAGAALKVVLADDSVLLRAGIASLLEQAGFEVVGQADNADDLLRRSGSPARRGVVDIRMPPTQTDEGLRAAREIRAALPGDRRAGALAVRRGRRTRSSCSPTAPRASATCSRTGSPTWTTSSTPCAASPTGGSALDPAVVRQLVGRRRAATTRWMS